MMKSTVASNPAMEARNSTVVSSGFSPGGTSFKDETDFRFSASSTATGGLLVFSFAGTLFPSPEISFPALLRLYRNQSLNAPA
jgi:hypothetical protein